MCYGKTFEGGDFHIYRATPFSTQCQTVCMPGSFSDTCPNSSPVSQSVRSVSELSAASVCLSNFQNQADGVLRSIDVGQ